MSRTLRELVYEKQEIQEQSPYEAVLEQVRNAISKDYAEMLAQSITQKSASEAVKRLIGEYVAAHQLRVNGLSVQELSERLYGDMVLEEERNVQNRIIASISHDIKTPLTSVLGYSESLMKKDVSKERLQQYLSAIYSGAKDIVEIVEEFDGYIDDRLKQALKIKSVLVSFLAQMLEEEYEGELSILGCSFTVQNTCEPDVTVSIDLARMRRVFANLIGNAVRHNADMDDLHIGIRLMKLPSDQFFYFH